MTPARFRWGLLFILFGVLLLLVQLEVVYHDIWFNLVYFLPVLLIAIGIEKIFARTRLKFISYLTSVLIFLAGLTMALDHGLLDDRGSFFEPSVIRQHADPAVVQIHAVLRLGDGDLTVRDATDDLLYGRFGEWTVKPDYDYQLDDGEARIELASTDDSKFFFGKTVRVDTDEPGDWRLAFSRTVPLIMELYGDKSDIHLNLSTTPIQNLRLEADDATIYLKLGGHEVETQVRVLGIDSKLRLRVPTESGLMVRGIEDGDFLEDVGMLSLDGYYVTDGFDTVSKRITIDLEDQFRSLSVDFY